jgi:hypothetical protein
MITEIRRSIRAATVAAVMLGAPLLAAPILPETAWGQEDSCIECHGMLGEMEERLAKPVKEFARGIHAKRGLSCAACHGGDPSDPDITSMDPSKGFKGVPAKDEIAEVCASCHADAAFMKKYDPQPYVFSMHEFRTSVHCKRVGIDPKVATCTDCHGVHGILPYSDPESPVYARNVPYTCTGCHNSEYLKGRRSKTDQLALYEKSVHGVALLERGDLSAPACNDCHGNHGAAPPGIRDVSLVCGTCHGREAELFNGSAMKAAMDNRGWSGCVDCHGNHDVERPDETWLSTGPDGKCGQCHETGSLAEAQTDSIITSFHVLRARIDEADSLLSLAEFKGMETEHGRAQLREAQNQIIGGRASLHSFDAERITTTVGEGIEFAATAIEEANGALRDWRVRRIGLAAALVVIAILIIALIRIIRALDARGGSQVASTTVKE